MMETPFHVFLQLASKLFSHKFVRLDIDGSIVCFRYIAVARGRTLTFHGTNSHSPYYQFSEFG